MRPSHWRSRLCIDRQCSNSPQLSGSLDLMICQCKFMVTMSVAGTTPSTCSMELSHRLSRHSHTSLTCSNPSTVVRASASCWARLLLALPSLPSSGSFSVWNVLWLSASSSRSLACFTHWCAVRFRLRYHWPFFNNRHTALLVVFIPVII